MKIITLIGFLFSGLLFNVSNGQAIDFPTCDFIWNRKHESVNNEATSSTVTINGVLYKHTIKIGIDSNDKPTSFNIEILALQPEPHNTECTDDSSQSAQYTVKYGFAEGIFYDNTCYMHYLHVNLEARNKGIGEYLLKNVFALAQEKNIDQVLWHAQPFDTENNHSPKAMNRLVTWYKKFGGTTPQGISKSMTPMLYPLKNIIQGSLSSTHISFA